MLLRRTWVMVPLAALSACASWRGPGDEEEGYEEVIERLAITPTGDKLVVVGRRYHYTFANPPTSLTRTIQSRLRPLLAADFQAFKVVDDVLVRGTWVLSLRVESMSDDNAALAKALGFVLDGNERYVLRGEISGRVHTNENVQFPSDWQRTNNPYRLHVAGRVGPPGTVSRSPISVATDGVLMLGLILLIPFFIAAGGCMTCTKR